MANMIWAWFSSPRRINRSCWRQAVNRRLVLLILLRSPPTPNVLGIRCGSLLPPEKTKAPLRLRNEALVNHTGALFALPKNWLLGLDLNQRPAD